MILSVVIFQAGVQEASGLTHGTLLQGHRFPIQALAFAPDGQSLASAGGQLGHAGEVKLWDLVTGRERATVWAHIEVVYALAFAPDRTTLVTGGADTTVKLWDLATGRERTTWQAHPPRVIYALAFAPDGQTLAAVGVGRGATVTLWDITTGQSGRCFNGCHLVAFAPVGQTLVTGRLGSQGLQLWDYRRNQAQKSLPGHAEPVYCLAYAPDGKTLATGHKDGSLELWDLDQLRMRWTQPGHQRPVNAVAFAPDGQTLATGSDDQIVRLWNVTTGGGWPVSKAMTVGSRPWRSLPRDRGWRQPVMTRPSGFGTPPRGRLGWSLTTEGNQPGWRSPPALGVRAATAGSGRRTQTVLEQGVLESCFRSFRFACCGPCRQSFPDHTEPSCSLRCS
ncbi:MAG: WD40 repeat domain-containing protein [Gemmataceae bacterium]|nr:WD40 repeat domain-containing protein [Gemmataceae bacterium]